MGKGKLKRFEEMASFHNVFQPHFNDIYKKDFYLKSKWANEVFGNRNPIVLELGCGKGEYTIGLAKRFPKINFIGVDIKGARMWKGAREANEKVMDNVAFLRTRIEFINSFFDKNEINEIWITFPDPQLKKRRHKKRLTSSRFLNAYKKIIIPGGIIHLKTDSKELYDYTLKIISYNNLDNVYSTDDLYNNGLMRDIPEIKTFYELIYINEGKKITYIKFKLNNKESVKEPPDDEE